MHNTPIHLFDPDEVKSSNTNITCTQREIQIQIRMKYLREVDVHLCNSPIHLFDPDEVKSSQERRLLDFSNTKGNGI